ncbi:MAG: asparagine synthetase B [Candidatus Bathyarchaeia archaeon]
MGGLAAIISKTGRCVAPEAIRMLSALRHRGNELHGITTGKIVTFAKDLLELSHLLKDTSSDIIIGYNFRRLLPEDSPQPIEIDNLKVVLEGRIYSPYSGKSEVYKIIEQHREESVRKVISEVEGSFIIAILSGKRLIIGRDSIGATPLYFSENDHFIALASERKALWSIGMDNASIKTFPPGNLAEISSEGIAMRQIKVLEALRPRIIKDEENILMELHNMLSEAIRRRLYGLNGGVSLAFSGGLDSSIIAALLKKAGVNATLVTVGLEGSKDIEQAEETAKEIGLRVKTETYTIKDVEEVLPKVLWLIEEANSLKASIKIPEYWAAEVSSKIDCKVMFFGEGGDELFGGYYKYLREYEKSLENAEMALFFDVISLYSSLEMSEKICTFHNVEARFPYADHDLALFALKIPISMKISSKDDPLRKRILRRYAEQIGLPADVYLRPKKAIQYGTGVSKVLKKIAKRNELNVQAFIDKVFREKNRFIQM